MKVRIKTRPSGLYNGAAWPEAGKVIDLPDHVATSMLADKTVEPVKGPKVETATPPAKVETAAQKTGRKNAKRVAAPSAPDAAGKPADEGTPAATDAKA